MYLKKVDGPRAVKLANGRVISVSDLPPEDTSRWVASRKEVVVLAVEYGLISKETALNKYQLSDEEFESWISARKRFGAKGLKATQVFVTRQP